MRLVALHGFLGHSSDFSLIHDALARRLSRYQFWAPNLFASDEHEYLPKNKSSWPSMFYRQHTQEMPFSLKPLPGSPRILLGYSFGGRLALELLNDRADVWDHVFILSANPGFLRDHERTERLISDQAWAKRFRNDKWSDVISSWNAQPVFADTHEPERYEGDYSRETLGRALDTYSQAQMSVTKEKLRSENERLKWVGGEKDSKITKLYSALRTDGIIQNLEIIKDSGHRVIFDQPDLVADLLVRAAKL